MSRQHFDLRMTVSQMPFNPDEYKANVPHKHRLRHYTFEMRKVIDFLKERYLGPEDKLIAGFETKNKHGEFTKPHFHIRFTSGHQKEAMRKALRELWKEIFDVYPSGNSVWKFTLVIRVENDRKFWQYPLKQYLDWQGLHGPPKEDEEEYVVDYINVPENEVKEMMLTSNAEWKTTCEVNNAKASRKEEKDTLYDRLEKKLDEGEGTLEEIIQFYMNENRPINDQTVVGYYNLYRLKRKRLTNSEYAAMLAAKFKL